MYTATWTFGAGAEQMESNCGGAQGVPRELNMV